MNILSFGASKKTATCIFCEIVAGKSPAEVYFQDDELVVFKDIKPCSKYHLLAIPKRHIDNVHQLTLEDKPLIERLVEAGKKVILEKGGNPDDSRIGFHMPPFNSISHLHLHVIAPVGDMSYLGRMIFSPSFGWFSTVDRILDKLSKGEQTANKL